MLAGNSITQQIAADQFNAWRLSDVIFKIKKMGYEVETRAEVHNGGTHARYIIHKKPTITLPPAFPERKKEEIGLFDAQGKNAL